MAATPQDDAMLKRAVPTVWMASPLDENQKPQEVPQTDMGKLLAEGWVQVIAPTIYITGPAGRIAIRANEMASYAAQGYVELGSAADLNEKAALAAEKRRAKPEPSPVADPVDFTNEPGDSGGNPFTREA